MKGDILIKHIKNSVRGVTLANAKAITYVITCGYFEGVFLSDLQCL